MDGVERSQGYNLQSNLQSPDKVYTLLGKNSLLKSRAADLRRYILSQAGTSKNTESFSSGFPT